MKTIARPDGWKAPVQFPSVDPSKMIFNKFEVGQTIVTGREYYFDDDNTFLNTIITAMRFHFWGGVLSDYNMSQFTKIGSTVYNTVYFVELTKILITLRDSSGEYLVDRQPVASLLTNYLGITFLPEQKYMRRWELKDVSLKGSFIQFVEVPLTPLPFVVPFTFFYK